MENNNLRNNTNTNTNTKNAKYRREIQIQEEQNTEQGTYRVIISKEANEVLEQLVNKISEDFEAGTITKSGVANYVFSNLTKLISDNDIKAIKNLYFDENKVLNSIIRRAREEGGLPEEIKKVLREHYGVIDKEKKRPMKNTQELPTSKAEGLFSDI